MLSLSKHEPVADLLRARTPAVPGKTLSYLRAPAYIPRPAVDPPRFLATERGAAWLAHQSGGLGVESSNLSAPTKISLKSSKHSSRSGQLPAWLDAAKGEPI